MIYVMAANKQTSAKKKKRALSSLLFYTFFSLLLVLITLPFIIAERQTTDQEAAVNRTQSYTPPSMRQVPDPLYGVTLDNVENLPGIVASLSNLTHRPTARIVFDEGQPPSYYDQAVRQIQPVSYILGMLADSTAIKSYSPQQYTQHTTDYLNAFGNLVDIWEIGNEINGEWLGTDVPAKMITGYNTVKAAGKRTALTLYYNGMDDTNNCYENQENLMFRWAEKNVPAEMKQGLDYVFVSFYEDDCPGVSKDWNAVFTKLHQMFPNSRIGFGENGTATATAAQSLKITYIQEYYPKWVNVPCYVAGNFWWYFYQDGIPHTNNPLWTAINNSMNALPVPNDIGCGDSGGIKTDPTPTLQPYPTQMLITPTLYCLGGCQAPSQPVQTPAPITITPANPEITEPIITENPLPTGTENLNPKEKKVRKNNGNTSFLQLFLNFIREILAFIFSLFRRDV